MLRKVQAVTQLIKIRNDYRNSKENVQSQIFNGANTDELTVIMLIDLNNLRDRIAALHAAFPTNFLHSFAAKANPVRKILQEVSTNGMGVECASKGELLQALRAGVPKNKIFLDSPAKTFNEIKFAIENDISLNIDNFQELERVKSVLNDNKESKSVIGIRINPQVGEGALSGLSTGTKTSKFGIAYDDYQKEILDILVNLPFLHMLHCHVGSQGCDFSLMTAGIRKIVGLAKAVNSQVGFKKITTINIGGGLPVNFASEQTLPTFEQYSKILQQSVPELFNDDFQVVTEFGRAVMAKTGVTVCEVEYTKQSGGKNFAVIQAGTDLFIRTVYHPDKWPLRVTVSDQNGAAKVLDNTKVYDVSGPCCLGMDIVAFNRELPEVEPNDHIIIHDTAAYNHSSYSYYNSRSIPPLIGYENDPENPDQFKFQQLFKIKTVEDTVNFFS